MMQIEEVKFTERGSVDQYTIRFFFKSPFGLMPEGENQTLLAEGGVLLLEGATSPPGTMRIN